ncbi:hypothetical protein PQO03_17635 [Lentisphaera profundi]|uniref:Inositol monophosphatase n=1 Tax=Lentisphaera profundi TaxID=1658616 RepID=A0ABY7VUS0_9BACT|nr:inositol monophosphatase family protein [Lentisphaera profundi]WDE97651.1 hypothetical protein PQO03_17635 [Lentisphaera profundi]
MNWNEVRNFLLNLGEAIADYAHKKICSENFSSLSSVHSISNSDTIYQIDSYAEEVIVRVLEQQAHKFGGIVLIAEGIGEDEITSYPNKKAFEDCQVRIIMDPIDGTRGLMYDKRSAFFLAGVAKNLGSNTSLTDIFTSVMVEIPTSKMIYGDSLSALKDEGLSGYRRNILTQEKQNLELAPSQETHLRGGFAQISRFFSPGRTELAQIEEELIDTLYPDAQDGEILNFEDQYISTGGQLYEMIMGKDRFIADIRPALYNSMKHLRKGHVCHPYDMASLLIVEEAGIIITDIHGQTLNAPMNTQDPINWIAYANKEIHKEVSSVFHCILEKHGLK